MTIRLGFHYRKSRVRKVALGAVEGAITAGGVTYLTAPGHNFLLVACIGAVVGGGVNYLLTLFSAWQGKGA